MQRKRFAGLLICAALVIVGESSHGQGRGNSRFRPARQPVPNQYIVVLNDGEDPGQVGREAAASHGGRALHTYHRALKGFSVRLTPGAAAALANDPRVRFIEEDSVITAQQVQTGPPPGLDRIDQRHLPLDGAYAYSELATFVRVHVIDTGIRVTHQEFQGRAITAGDYVDDDGDGDPADVGNDDGDPATPDGADCNGHGTHVAGTIGGSTYGVAKQVALYSHRVLACDGTGTVSSAIAAIDAITADSYRPAVANMSLGGGQSDALDSAVRSSIASGVTFVVAAGNAFADANGFSPARVPEAITVSATDANDTRAWFANFGSAVDLFAPGDQVLSAWFSSDTATALLSGTSMATPHVAGVAALYLSGQPDMTPAAVQNQLVSAATPNVVINPGAGSANRMLFSDLAHVSAPNIDLLQPDGGAKLLSGQPYSINWDASDPDGISSFDVLLSVDGGASYAPLAECTMLDGAQRQCTWASPGPVTNTARIRVVVRDALGDSTFDQSSGNFAIVSLADMVTTLVTHSPGPLAPGATFTATDTVRNVGNVPSPASTTRFYLSLDSVKSISDVQLATTRAVPSLAPDTESIGTTTLGIPSTIPSGTYTLLACADALRTVNEVDESNNCTAASLALGIEYADLAATAVSSPPSSAAPGTSFTLSDSVQNVSGVTAMSSTTRYYLSTDTTKDPADVLLSGTRSVPSLAAGDTSAGGRSITVPSTTATGTYRLLACADDTLRIREQNEADNCAASGTTVFVASPDLVTSLVSHPASPVAPGATLTVTDTVLNTGPIVAGTSTTRYYLSVDSGKSSDDFLLSGTRSVASLAPGGMSAGSKTTTVPWTTSPGSYRLLACADDTLVVKESDETNNCLVSATPVLVELPDLVATAVSNPPAAAAPGSTFTVTDTTANAGSVGATFSTTRYYLSIDGMKSAEDVLIAASRFVGALAGGAASSGSRTITVPAATPSGTYRVIACADDTLTVTESDESNNCAASATSVLIASPDLLLSALSSPPSNAAPGSSFVVTDTVTNAGSAPAVASYVRYYLSADTVITPDDLLLTASRFVAALGPNGTSTGSRTLTVPAATPPGVYYVLACADDTQKNVESDESNNCKPSATGVTVGG